MSKARICPNCKAAVPADAPEGVCPACALRAGFETEVGPDSPTRTDPGSPAAPLPVEQLAERLPELEQFELIGQGGMGAVYRARHVKLDRPVAVKIVDARLRDDAAFEERFTREARTMAQLNHPNVVSVYDFGHREDLYYLIMEFVDGVNLRQTIEAGELDPHEALALVPHICSALQYAHDKGVVHRDIKPENILIDRNGTIKIADFGLAKLMGNEGSRRLTGTRQVMGTPHYMAPEQIENPAAVDHRADIFALGVVFYELLTGELPVGRFPPPSKKVQIDVRLDDVVLRTLEKEPSLRYQQASELRTDVESISSGDSVVAARPESPSKQGADYEYRSKATILGWPVIHIASSRDPAGKRMRVARGIIAIGDVAIGGVAIGVFSFGGITFGVFTVGLTSLGGIALGLLTAIGGVAAGGFAFGGVAIGLVAVGGWSIRQQAMIIATMLIGWAVAGIGATIGVACAIIAFIKAGGARGSRNH